MSVFCVLVATNIYRLIILINRWFREIWTFKNWKQCWSWLNIVRCVDKVAGDWSWAACSNFLFRHLDIFYGWPPFFLLSIAPNFNLSRVIVRQKKKNKCVSGSPTDPSSNPPTLTFFFTFQETRILKWRKNDKKRLKFTQIHSDNVS